MKCPFNFVYATRTHASDEIRRLAVRYARRARLAELSVGMLCVARKVRKVFCLIGQSERMPQTKSAASLCAEARLAKLSVGMLYKNKLYCAKIISVLGHNLGNGEGKVYGFKF